LVAIARRTSSDTVRFDIQAPLDPRHNFSADNRVYNTIWDGHNDTKPFRIPSISIASLSLSFEAHLGPSSTLGRWHFALSLRHRIFDQLPEPGPRAQVSRGLSGCMCGSFLRSFLGQPGPEVHSTLLWTPCTKPAWSQPRSRPPGASGLPNHNLPEMREPKQAQESARTASPNCNISHRELSRLHR
jgi:hypothetical protein